MSYDKTERGSFADRESALVLLGQTLELALGKLDDSDRFPERGRRWRTYGIVHLPADLHEPQPATETS